MSFMSPEQPKPITPEAMPQPVAPPSAPTSSRPGRRSSQPTLAAGATPSMASNVGGKTLLGQ